MNTPEEVEAIRVVERTREEIKKKGWCIWTCKNLDNDKIIVAADNYQFSMDVKYPVYTLSEIEDLAEKTEKYIRFIHTAKKEGAVRTL